MCIPFFQATITNLQTGQSYCAAMPMSFPWWALLLLLGVLAFAILPRGSHQGKRRSENDEIIDILNKLIPPYQDEAQRNLADRSRHSDQAAREYEAFRAQIEHDGEGYRYL